MKICAIPVWLCVTLLSGGLIGCSSTPRQARKPSAAIVISGRAGERPSPAEVAEIHKLYQPEIERRGYVMAKSSGAADYFVHLRYPVDLSSVGRLTFVRAEPTVPFLRQHETERERREREIRTTTAETVRDPGSGGGGPSKLFQR